MAKQYLVHWDRYPMHMQAAKNSEISKNSTLDKAPTPFLKWAGGKRKLTPILLDAFPKNFNPEVNRFYEPFLGGGALSFALGNPESNLYIPGKNLYINDMNPDLINTYTVLRDDVTSLIKELKKFEKLNNSESFYEIRATQYKDEVRRAARFIFLNKTCFNGLWRVNSSGAFNVPYGRYKNPKILDSDNLQLCSTRLKGSKISLNTYKKAVANARENDLVYFDPPYIPLTKTAAFSQYAKEDFGLEDQRELASVIDDLSGRGVYVILSNSDTKLTREIFAQSVTLRQILVARTISAQAATRRAVHEVIGTNYTISRKSKLQEFKLLN
jgi:DNA adenine methylase